MGNEYKKISADKKAEAGKIMTSTELSACNVAIHSASVAAAAGGMIPIPGADAIPISLTQVTMVIALGKIFGQELTSTTVKGIIGTTASTIVGRSLFKVIPVVGWAASAAVAAGVTEAMGWTLAVNFATESQKNKMEEANKEEVRQPKDTFENEEVKEGKKDVSGNLNEECEEDASSDSDDESISNDFSKLFGEDE